MIQLTDTLYAKHTRFRGDFTKNRIFQLSHFFETRYYKALQAF